MRDATKKILRRLRVAPGTIGIAVATVMLASCINGRADFDRHSMSRIWLPDSGSEIVFEASVGPLYPADSVAAEATRERWLAQWLESRDLCPQGHRILERRPFQNGEDNPYAHDLVYRVACVGEQ